MPGSPATTWIARALLVLTGTAMALVVGELGLRLIHPTLPSLAALDGVGPREWGDVQRWTSPPTELATCGAAEAPVRYPPRTEQHGEGPRRSLWVVGDSIVHGFGVGPTDAWPQRLAATLAADLGTGIALTRLGGPGLGYCGWASSLNKHLAHGLPDAAVVQVFADDLERRDLVLVRGSVAAIPRHPLLQRSWLANRLWLARVAHLGSARPTRDADAAGRARFRSVVSGTLAPLAEAGVPVLLVLVPPAGQGRCTRASAGFSDCDWLLSDQELLATELTTLDHPWLDLRSVWADAPPDTLPDEEAAWTARGRLPVHPGPQGHETLAQVVHERLLPMLTESWSPQPSVAHRP